MGFRKPSIKKSIKSRTTGKLKRKVKAAVNPFYGKKGIGWVKNPKKAMYNKIYQKTTRSAIPKGCGCSTIPVIVVIILIIIIIIISF